MVRSVWLAFAMSVLLPTTLLAQTLEATLDAIISGVGEDERSTWFAGEIVRVDGLIEEIVQVFAAYPNATYQKLQDTDETAVYAIRFRNAEAERDLYAYLLLESGQWKLEAVRALFLPAFVQILLHQLAAIETRTEEQEWQYKNLLLMMSSDRVLKQHLLSNREAFEQIINWPHDRDWSERDALLRSLYIENTGKTEQNPFVRTFAIGGILDNEVGYLHVPDGEDPPVIHQSDLIYVEHVIGNWYVYKTT